MDVTEAVISRSSIRGFLPKPVDPALLRRVIETAARAPSGGNLQPWHIDVVGGGDLDALKQIMAARVLNPEREPPEYDIYPKDLPEPYRSHRFQVGEDLYGALGIPHDDKAARLQWFARNFLFFGAPIGLFCTVARSMGPPQWSDLGMYLQTLMLLLREAGLDSCPQECWAVYPQTVRNFLCTPPERMLFTGMAIGYRDGSDPANSFTARRAGLAEFATFRGL